MDEGMGSLAGRANRFLGPTRHRLCSSSVASVVSGTASIRADRVRIIQGSALALPVPDGAFDAALDPWVFETGEWKRPGWIRK